MIRRAFEDAMGAGQRDIMAKDSDLLSGSFAEDDAEGWLSHLLADEDDFDRNTLWRLGSWGVAAVGALTLGIMAGQLPFDAARPKFATADLAFKTQQVEWIAQESQTENRRLSAAIDTLNKDRDRLYGRLNTIEQGLDSITGSITKKEPPLTPSPAAVPQKQATPDAAVAKPPASDADASASARPATGVRTVTASATTMAVSTPPTVAASDALSTPASQETPNRVSAPRAESPTVSVATPADGPGAKSDLVALAKPADPEPLAAPLVAGKPSDTAVEPEAAAVTADPDAAEAAEADDAAPETAVQHTSFGLDLGGASSMSGLRTLWKTSQKTKARELRGFRPIVTFKERNNGLGLQLRLVAGPIADAAAAARICAALNTKHHNCEPVVFEGQRLTMPPDELPRRKPAPLPHRRSEIPRETRAAIAEAPATADESPSILPRFLRPR